MVIIVHVGTLLLQHLHDFESDRLTIIVHIFLVNIQSRNWESGLAELDRQREARHIPARSLRPQLVCFLFYPIAQVNPLNFVLEVLRAVG